MTQVDLDSEAAIREVLARETPGIPFLGEEGGGDIAETAWVVDPLDGTTNFMRGLPVVGVAVSLIEAGLPRLGVVIAPFLGLELAGERARGATCNGERMRSLVDRPAAASVVATGFPFRRKERMDVYQPVLLGALGRFEDLRRAGAASLDLAWTAAGALDGFFELSLGTWDMAAGAVLVLELGGRITDWSGGQGWLQSGDILAGTPSVHEALLEMAGAAANR